LLFGEEEKNCVNRFDFDDDGLRLLSVDGVATVVVVELAKGFLGSLLDIVVMYFADCCSSIGVDVEGGSTRYV